MTDEPWELTLPGEKWRPIPGLENYLLSNYGRFYSRPRVVIRSNGRPQRIRGRILATCRRPSGFVTVTLWGSGRRSVGLSVGKLVRELWGDEVVTYDKVTAA